ncbi:MAG: putative inorganic carbon (HCO3(-)) transporter, partial [Paraglaciecola sp.]
MRDIFIVIVILILYYFSFRSAYAACLTYWWFNIFRPQDWVYMDIGSLKLPLLATVIFFMVSIARGYRPKINDKLSVMMVLFWLLGTIASLIYGCSSEYKVIEPIEYLGLLFIA